MLAQAPSRLKGEPVTRFHPANNACNAHTTESSRATWGYLSMKPFENRLNQVNHPMFDSPRLHPFSASKRPSVFRNIWIFCSTSVGSSLFFSKVNLGGVVGTRLRADRMAPRGE